MPCNTTAMLAISTAMISATTSTASSVVWLFLCLTSGACCEVVRNCCWLRDQADQSGVAGVPAMFGSDVTGQALFGRAGQVGLTS